jgi:hypothetical protein
VTIQPVILDILGLLNGLVFDSAFKALEPQNIAAITSEFCGSD